VPQTCPPEQNTITGAGGGSEPEGPAAPAVRVRRPDGGIAHFDEIVTPHPAVAFLFRRRTFLVLVGILAIVPFARPQPLTLAVGIGLAVLAEAWRFWAAGTIHKTEELTTGGPYAIVRHPLYVGSFGHAIAFCLMSGRWESALLVIPLFVLVYGAAVTTEEAMLHELFGEEYAAYSLQVPRFLPALRRPRPGRGRFCWRQAMLNKEYVNVIWLVLLSGLFVWRAQ